MVRIALFVFILQGKFVPETRDWIITRHDRWLKLNQSINFCFARILKKISFSITQTVYRYCDQFKRVKFVGQMTGQNSLPFNFYFYVDCEGYDTDGNLIFEELKNCRQSTQNRWLYPHVDGLSSLISASVQDFSHCVQCNRCEPNKGGNFYVNRNIKVSSSSSIEITTRYQVEFRRDPTLGIFF